MVVPGAGISTPMSSASGSETSGSGLSSESGSSSESENESPILAKPVFVKKNQKNTAPSSKTGNVLAKAEFQQNLESKEAKVQSFDGVDDTDDIDPEGEFEAWKQRERARKERDLKVDDEDEAGGKGGVFYQGVGEELIGRESGEAQLDHSRPTRWKPT